MLNSPSPLMSPAYRALASRMGNSGELARDLRGAMMTAGSGEVARLGKSVSKGERTTGTLADHEESRVARAKGGKKSGGGGGGGAYCEQVNDAPGGE